MKRIYLKGNALTTRKSDKLIGFINRTGHMIFYKKHIGEDGLLHLLTVSEDVATRIENDYQSKHHKRLEKDVSLN